jgi:hypothetical protein
MPAFEPLEQTMNKSIVACLGLAGFAITLLSVAPASGAQNFTCPVTRPAPSTFEPVGVFKNSNLVGTEKLFTIFPGNWHTVQKTDRGYRIPKLVWGTKVVDLRDEIAGSSLTLTGRRLDADSGPLLEWDTNTAWIDPLNRTGPSGKTTPVAEIGKESFFITSSLFVPALGCWEVTGRLHGEDLKIVIDVTSSALIKY